MVKIRIPDDLWATSMMPEGLLERWRASDGQKVEAGQVVAEVTIEDATHDIVAPAAGRLVHKVTSGTVIEPGSLLAELDDLEAAASKSAA